MAMIIIDLLGRKFKVISQSWDLVIDPIKEKTIPQDWLPCYTADRYTHQTIVIYHSPDQKDYIMQLYAPHLMAYIHYRLELLGYYEKYDMRLEYKYGKVKLPKQ